MFKNWFVILVLSPLLLLGNIWEAEEESLFVRRIADFWEEGEYALAQGQMEEFIALYPESTFRDPLANALADLLIREKKYKEALSYYDLIQDPKLKEAAFAGEMQCLYALGEHGRLASTCEELLESKKLNDDEREQILYFLTLSLYNEAILRENDAEKLAILAEKIEPHFASLLKREASPEIREAFAHFSSLVKQYEKAADLYLQLAQEIPAQEKEYLFQAALAQAKFDPSIARETFEKLAATHKEAAFNWLVLSFESGHFADILKSRELLLAEIPEERQLEAKLLFGRALLAEKEYGKATLELLSFVKESKDKTSLRGALLALLQASFEEIDMETFHFALSLFENEFPADPEIPNYLFSKGELEKKTGRLNDARETFRCLLEANPKQLEALYELATLEYEANSFEKASLLAEEFLTLYPDHTLSPFMWRYLASATSNLAKDNPKAKLKLVKTLETMLTKSDLFKPEELLDWQFLFAKVLFDLKAYPRAEEIISSLLSQEFPQKANALLLSALCEREENENLPRFCSLAEEALRLGADLLDKGSIHTSLFNAYLKEGAYLQAADHLFFAFEAKAPIQKENLLWLADTYASLVPTRAQKLVSLLEEMIAQNLATEDNEISLASAYLSLKTPEKAISLLQGKPQKEAKLLLGKALLAVGKEEEALPLFDFIVASSPNVRTETAASAFLESLKIRAKGKELSPQVLLGLKDLMLQKSLANEPIHLESALLYATLQNRNALPEKQIALWEKIKMDFEKTDDLLSQDYAASKSHFPEKARLVEQYLMLMDAEILFAKRELAEGHALLLKILEETPDQTLALRVKHRLEEFGASE